MGKARMAVRLKEAVGGKSHNRSQDLDSLAKRYYAFRKSLRDLLVACQSHHKAMMVLNKTRIEVANSITAISKDTPIYPAAGQLPDAETARSAVLSFASVHHTMSSKSKNYADKYKQFVIDYIAEWGRVVTTRVDKGLRNAELLRRDLDHYQKKVESLRGNANQKLSKGKQVNADAQEKLNRNEQKLIQAKEQYNKFATDMCLLLDEVTDRNWKDLHPVLIKMCQFDATISKDEATHLASLYQVVDALKAVAETHQLKPQARLKELETQQVALLSTREETNPLAIGDGEANNGSVFGTPRSFGAQSSFGADSTSGSSVAAPAPPATGMGGYPVPIAAAPLAPMAPAPMGHAMSTNDMLAISRAAPPPPSMDEIHGAMQHTSLNDPWGRQSPGPMGRYGMTNGGTSGEFSAYGAPAGPAPVAPPPPPPGPPPPPPPPTYGTPSSLPMANAVPVGDSPAWSTGYGAPAAPINATQMHPNANPFGDPPAGGAPAYHARQDPPQGTNPFGY